MARTCPYCKQSYRFVHTCEEMPQNKAINEKLYSPPFKEGFKEGKRIVIVNDTCFSADGVGKHLEMISKIAESYGYAFKSETHTQIDLGITCSFVFEKIVTTTNETHFVNCTYCKTRFDANQYFKCPNCGGQF